MRNIVETATNSIINLIQDGIGEPLDALAIQRPDGVVSLENPPQESYFIYEKAITYRCPAVFVVPTDVDFRLGNGPNHINALISMIIACVVEDRDQSLLQLKCFRYADALHTVLSRAVIDDGQQKDVIKVMGMTFSSTSESHSSEGSIFQKEVVLKLSVEHYEGEN